MYLLIVFVDTLGLTNSKLREMVGMIDALRDGVWMVGLRERV